MKVAVLIPHGGTCPHRDRALAYVLGHYQRNHPWPVHLGTSGEPWSKGAAVADAFTKTDADMLVIADADSFTDADSLNRAVSAAVDCGWAIPHALVYRLNEEGTRHVYAGGEPRKNQLARGAYTGVKAGGILAITREAYTTVGGIDARFCGWGGEDVSLAHALHCLVGPHCRFSGDLWHLWHPHPAPDLRGSPESEALVARYLAARRDPIAMRSLIEEARTP